MDEAGGGDWHNKAQRRFHVCYAIKTCEPETSFVLGFIIKGYISATRSWIWETTLADVFLKSLSFDKSLTNALHCAHIILPTTHT